MLAAETLTIMQEHEQMMPETGIPEAVDIKPETYMLTMRIGVVFAEDQCRIITEMLRDGAPDPAYLLDIAGQCLRFYEYLAPVYEQIRALVPDDQSSNGLNNLLHSMLEESKESSEG